MSLAPLAGSAAGGKNVKIKVSSAPKSANSVGPLISLSPTSAGGGDGAVRVAVEVDKLGVGFGANWAERSRLVQLPACSLTTPQVDGCLKQTSLVSHFDPKSRKLTADVVLPAANAAEGTDVRALSSPTGGVVLSPVSQASSGAGTYAASSLNPSAAWAAGSNSGAFTYSYALQSPPTLGGATPQVAFSYDSSSVDGKTSSTNAQASWIGDGWSYAPGFVERSYKPCLKAGITGSGDECWAGANLTLALAGHSGQLVPHDASCQSGAPAAMEQSSCTWRLQGDDGTKVEFLTGATNDTWNGSYIKVTDTGGTVYYFGLNHLPDAAGNPTAKGPAANSAWAVPVYSPNSGDPCYDAAKGKASWCQAGWRWNLDHVVDPHGNLTTYSYTQETNYYARGGGQNNGTGTNTAYTRSGYLSTIAYGQQLGDQIAANGTAKSAAKIAFNPAERCTTSPTACAPAQRTKANAANWPDVPLDQNCDQSGSCTNYSPTFWTTKWLESVTTQVLVSGGYQDVDLYELDHRFVKIQNSTESTQVPWLGSVKRTGKDIQASSTQLPLPAVSFTEALLPNRVDGTDLVPSRPAFNRPRIQLITTETGASIGVDYWPADCSRVSGSMPASADTDTRSCFNVKWHPPTEQPNADPIDDWFQKYPVKTVTTNPGTPGSVPTTATYTYGKAAWHRNDSPFTDTKDRTWDQFRGYASVTSVTGNGADGPKSQSTISYYQGMNGDITSSGTRSATVAGAKSGNVADEDWLYGQTLETDTYDQAGGSIVSYSVSTSSGPVPTATHAIPGLPALTARYSGTTMVSTSKEIKADGSWRATSTTTTTDSDHSNRVTSVLSTADGLPDTCARTSYANAASAQTTALVSEVLAVSGTAACTAAPTASNTMSWKRTYYDDLPLGQAGSKGEAKAAESIDRFDGSTAKFIQDAKQTYDKYGRVLTATDPNATDSAHASGAVTTTVYSAANQGELPNSVTVTAPAPAGASDAATGRTTTTVLDTARGLPKTVTDPNGRVTTTAHDALGRLTAVWLPGRPTAKTASKTFTYSVPGIVDQKVVPPSVTVATLAGTTTGGDTYRTEIQIMDGSGRTIQTQSTPALSAYTGRIITDIAYNSQGQTVRTNSPWYNKDAPPGTVLYQTATAQEIPSQAYTVFDGLGRPVSVQSIAYGVVQNTTTMSYPGWDRTDVTPPPGSTPTSTVTDSRGHTVQLWQYKTAGATGKSADADIATYTYTPAGQAAGHTDAAGNTWTYTYDLRGRRISSTDPDTGTSTTAYDTAGRVLRTTDARQQSITYAYDLLGRSTATYAGTVVDPAKQLTSRTYDTVVKGQPSTSTRYDGGTAGKAYTRAVLSYDTAYHPTKTTLTVPGADVGATGPFTYTTQASYDPGTGLLKASNRSAVADIPAETINYSYDKLGPLQSYGAFGTTYDLSNDYDAYGRSVRTTVNPWGTQIVVTNNFDEPTGRLLSQYVDKQTAATGAVQQTSYAYDQSGRTTAVRSIADNTPAAADLQCFTYDYLGRLATAWTDTGGLTMAPQPAVGGQGSCTNPDPTSGAKAPNRTTVGGPAAYWQTYRHDLTGNRTQTIQHDPAGDSSKDTTVDQTFHPAATVNTPTTAQNTGGGTGGPHALLGSTTSSPTGPGASSLQYDAVGNTTTITDNGGTSTLTWNEENRLASLNRTAGAVSRTYLYDADGALLIRRDGTKTTFVLGDDELVYDSSNSTTTGTRYYQMPGGLTLVRQAAASTFQITDPHGTAALSLDSATLAETRRPTDPFGVPRGTQPTTWAGTRGFVGGMRDDATGLTSLGARQYQATTGRFLSPDPLLAGTDPQQWNGYAYSSNDPVNLSDPSGLMACRTPDECDGGTQVGVNTPSREGLSTTATATNGHDADGSGHQKRGTRSNGTCCRTQKIVVYPGVAIPEDWDKGGEFIDALYSVMQNFCAKDWGKKSCPYTNPDYPITKHQLQNTIMFACIDIGKDNCPGEVFNIESLIQAALEEGINYGREGPVGLNGRLTTGAPENGWSAARATHAWEQRGGCSANSFPAGTQVLLADGTRKPIEDIQVGDTVIATDPQTGETGTHTVTATIRTPDDRGFTTLTVRGSDGTDEALTATDHHPFWSESRHTWVDTADLRPGDRLLTDTGATAEVVSTAHHDWTIAAYNLTVDDVHTYYVLAGNTPALVHNAGGFWCDSTKPVVGDRPDYGQTSLYAIMSKDGLTVEKWGITNDPVGRYSMKKYQAFGDGSYMQIIRNYDSKAEALANERYLTQRWPGPWNDEHHAGTVTPAGPLLDALNMIRAGRILG
ncbi:polymorphic toxin-type HINT domain-containing protein [Kitasatospora sp. NPDC051914]|uniref:polymorphic toxin-type HINT domain-containing protein n=1 Tax=Kitasatospora sp. NPDC051914 TaxID=3154945 RepID=UPI003431E4D8